MSKDIHLMQPKLSQPKFYHISMYLYVISYDLGQKDSNFLRKYEYGSSIYTTSH